jgi:hypothetical protein
VHSVPAMHALLSANALAAEVIAAAAAAVAAVMNRHCSSTLLRSGLTPAVMFRMCYHAVRVYALLSTATSENDFCLLAC